MTYDPTKYPPPNCERCGKGRYDGHVCKAGCDMTYGGCDSLFRRVCRNHLKGPRSATRPLPASIEDALTEYRRCVGWDGTEDVAKAALRSAILDALQNVWADGWHATEEAESRAVRAERERDALRITAAFHKCCTPWITSEGTLSHDGGCATIELQVDRATAERERDEARASELGLITDLSGDTAVLINERDAARAAAADAEAALTRVRALLPLWDQDRPCERPDCPNSFHVAATALRAALATPGSAPRCHFCLGTGLAQNVAPGVLKDHPCPLCAPRATKEEP